VAVTLELMYRDIASYRGLLTPVFVGYSTNAGKAR